MFVKLTVQMSPVHWQQQSFSTHTRCSWESVVDLEIEIDSGGLEPQLSIFMEIFYALPAENSPVTE